MHLYLLSSFLCGTTYSSGNSGATAMEAHGGNIFVTLPTFDDVLSCSMRYDGILWAVF